MNSFPPRIHAARLYLRAIPLLVLLLFNPVWRLLLPLLLARARAYLSRNPAREISVWARGALRSRHPTPVAHRDSQRRRHCAVHVRVERQLARALRLMQRRAPAGERRLTQDEGRLPAGRGAEALQRRFCRHLLAAPVAILGRAMQLLRVAVRQRRDASSRARNLPPAAARQRGLEPRLRRTRVAARGPRRRGAARAPPRPRRREVEGGCGRGREGHVSGTCGQSWRDAPHPDTPTAAPPLAAAPPAAPAAAVSRRRRRERAARGTHGCGAGTHAGSAPRFPASGLRA